MRSERQRSKFRDWIRANSKHAKSKDEFIKTCMSRFGVGRDCTRGSINDMISRGEDLGEVVGSKGRAGNMSQVHTPKKNVNSKLIVDVNEIAKEYDNDSMIEDGVKSLGNGLIKDNDFRTELGISFDRWKIVSTKQKFSNNKQELKGKRFRGLYWGSAAVIKELRKKIDLL